MPDIRRLRSLLFCGANREEKAQQIWSWGADAVLLDLEDALAPEEKPHFRAPVADLLRARRGATPALVRINGTTTPWCFGDVTALVGPWLDGVLLPKAETAEEVRLIDWLIGQVERDRDMTVGSTQLFALIETGLGLERAAAIAGASPRLRRLVFGAGDYTRSLGLEWTAAEDELRDARHRIANASAATGLPPPIDAPVLQVGDLARFETSAATARRLGFGGKITITPEQTAAANRLFSPSPDQIAWAKAQLAAFAAARAEGKAATYAEDVLVDKAIADRAARILAEANTA